MIGSLILDQENFGAYKSFANDEKISSFSKINIFIGSNNSGKSRFCRTFFLGSRLKYLPIEIPVVEINNLIKQFNSELDQINKMLFQSDDPFKIKDFIERAFLPIEYVNYIFSFDEAIFQHLRFIKNLNNNHLSNPNTKAHFNNLADRYHVYFDKIINNIESDSILFRSIYIPTLRGLRKVGGDSDVYKTRTIKDYFANDSKIVEDKIYTGLDLYEDTKKLLLGAKKDRDKVREFEKFLSQKFFNDKEVNIIPRIEKDVVYIRIDAEEFPIYDLGDGIQSIIIMTYPLFFRSNEYLSIFIEEPEHYLHPGYQRIFLETLLDERFNKFQYFITSHSNHFLDITLDVKNVSVYTFIKSNSSQENPSFTIENVENEDYNTLELLGVRNSSVFLSNCTIWVEGITDRVYLRKYLDVFQAGRSKRFIEDVHYSFVEYGGNNITHWSFLKDEDPKHSNINVERLCGKLFLITDDDGAKKQTTKTNRPTKKHLRHIELQEVLGERYYCLQSREIENLLTPVILKKAIKKLEGPTNNSLMFSSKFNKIENYKDAYLGKFIVNNVENLVRDYQDESGTVKDKVNFAKAATDQILLKTDLSEEALRLAEKLHNFISANN